MSINEALLGSTLIPCLLAAMQVSFVQHFMGCQTCMALNRNGNLELCQDGMFFSFNFTSRYHQPMLKDARPRSEGDLAQLRELPYCSNDPSQYGCAGAKPLAREAQEQRERVCSAPAAVCCPVHLLYGMMRDLQTLIKLSKRGVIRLRCPKSMFSLSPLIQSLEGIAKSSTQEDLIWCGRGGEVFVCNTTGGKDEDGS